MSLFSLNIMLALGWMLLNRSYSTEDFITGFAVGFLALVLTQPFQKKPAYGKRLLSVAKLIIIFLYQLVVGSLQVVWDVLTPTHLSTPKIINLPLTVTSDFQIMLLANLISLTPGTLILDLSRDKKYLVVHAMFAKDEAAIINDLKHSFEKLVIEATRE